VTFVGQNLGAGKRDRAFRGSLEGTAVAMAIAALIGGIVFLFAPTLIGLFGGSPEAVAIGTRQAHTIPPFYALLAFSHCMAAVQRGAGRSFVPMFVMMFIWCALRVTYISIVVRFIPKITVIFWAYPLTWTVSGVIFLIIFLRKKWLI